MESLGSQLKQLDKMPLQTRIGYSQDTKYKKEANSRNLKNQISISYVQKVADSYASLYARNKSQGTEKKTGQRSVSKNQGVFAANFTIKQDN